MAGTGPNRIWYRSFVHPIGQAPHIERLQALFGQVAGTGTRFEVQGWTADHSFHPLTEFRRGAGGIADRCGRGGHHPGRRPSDAAVRARVPS